MSEHHGKKLRYGFSTGACLSALACGLWRHINPKDKNGKAGNDSGAQNQENQISVTFLDDAVKSLPLIADKLDQGILQIQKDGGDDPDCTHLAVLSASLAPALLSDIQKEDYLLEIGSAKLILHTGGGIGLCTRKGLDCEEGKWAINTGPRKMLVRNLTTYGMGQNTDDGGIWKLTVSVENGEELAKKTLNKKLGIVGGISILGTTGHVKPFSHDAYIHTIKICTNAVMLENGSHVVYGTGARSLSQAKRYYPHLSENAFIPIADFIGKTLEIAKEAKVPEISICCMAGKLCKYANRQFYTHAHKEEQDLTLLHNIILELNFPENELEHMKDTDWKHAPSVREVLCSFSEKAQLQIIAELAEKAMEFFRSVYADAVFHILICDFDGNLLMTADSEKNHA